MLLYTRIHKNTTFFTKNARFICGDANDPAADGADTVILDPPRKGAMREALDAIIECGAQRIAYISCNPATLARDCRILADAGYRIESVRPYDMFANSFHVETVCLLRREGRQNK